MLAKNVEIEGDAVGVFHLENGQMVEYWLLERDQKMINDIFNLCGKALLAGGSEEDMAKGVATHPLALAPNGAAGRPHQARQEQEDALMAVLV